MAQTVRSLHFPSDPHRHLLNALEAGNVDGLRAAVAAGADPRAALLSDGTTALHRLAGRAPLLEPREVHALVTVLIELGAHADQLSAGGQGLSSPHTPLVTALTLRDRDATFVEALLDAGADPNALNGSPSWAERPLHMVLGVSHQQPARRRIVDALLAHGADPNLTNHEHLTVLQALARDPGRGEDSSIITALLEHGADLDLKPEGSSHPCAMIMLLHREMEVQGGDALKDAEYLLAPVVRSWREARELRATLAAAGLDAAPAEPRRRL